jgi:hypothetical protein
MLLPKTGKLIAYRPLLAEKSIFGYFVKEDKGNWIVNFDGKVVVCDPKHCTLVYNKRQHGYKEI